jgi:hypothetical protein
MRFCAQPNLMGAFATVDGKKKETEQGGRTTDPQLHKINYQSDKGDGPMLFVMTLITTGEIIYVDWNNGSRHESVHYRDYDVCVGVSVSTDCDGL